jgi:sigma-B regulation protein RsbU (phosphoserine phosphatase)
VSAADELDAFYKALLDDDAEALYERAPCGYLSTTPDGTVVKVNQTFLSWTGYERKDVVGRRTFSSLLTGGGRIYHETHYAPMLRMHDHVREIALDIVRADGTRLPALVNSVLERDAGGTPVVIRTAVFDATERRRYERDLLEAMHRAERSEAHATHLARTLQQTLIPPGLPTVPGLDIAAAYRPAGDGAEIGGDFYDVFEVADDDWMIVVGDVCGKGVEAAVVTAAARHAVRAAAVRRGDVRQVLTTVNEVLLREPTRRFCTMVVVRLRRRRRDGEWSMHVTSAGHPLPLLVRSADAVKAVGAAGLLLGVSADAQFTEAVVEIADGDVVVLYTDGVTEARAASAFFGEQRLQQLVATEVASAEELVRQVERSVVDFQDGRPRDDIVVLAVRPHRHG